MMTLTQYLRGALRGILINIVVIVIPAQIGARLIIYIVGEERLNRLFDSLYVLMSHPGTFVMVCSASWLLIWSLANKKQHDSARIVPYLALGAILFVQLDVFFWPAIHLWPVHVPLWILAERLLHKKREPNKLKLSWKARLVLVLIIIPILVFLEIAGFLILVSWELIWNYIAGC